MVQKIKKCRVCENEELTSILHLGQQTLTGLFPQDPYQKITAGPLELVKCDERNGCGLVQLRHSFDVKEMYGGKYGYRSGLNQSMVDHLQQKVKSIMKTVQLRPKDLVIDIGSNDGTLLRSYPSDTYQLLGIDPTGEKFKQCYPAHIELVCDFFSRQNIAKHCGKKKAKVITSIAMFYDLEDPVQFMRDVSECLDDEGVWLFEQSYLPLMLKKGAYDTICHEHLEYYRLKQIKWMTDQVGLKIIEVQLNEVNGGSFSVMVAKRNSKFKESTETISEILSKENKTGLSSLRPYEDFKDAVRRHRDQLLSFIKRVKAQNEMIIGYGASTKGNVILQFCEITTKDIPFIAEVNPDKFGCFTPGTKIPIISEAEAKNKKPNYLMVLPWHFRSNIIERENTYIESGGKLLFPLPAIEVYPN